MQSHERPMPSDAVDERETLTGFLRWQRATFEWKISELPDEGWDRTVAASTMTLAGLVSHLTFVEDHWSQTVFRGSEIAPWNEVDWESTPEYDWHLAIGADPETLVERWREACVRADEAYAAAEHVGQVAAAESQPVNLRWIYVHMIEEYARHNGHADLIREAIDGQTGE